MTYKTTKKTYKIRQFGRDRGREQALLCQKCRKQTVRAPTETKQTKKPAYRKKGRKEMEFYNRILANCILTAKQAVEDAAAEYVKLQNAEEYTDVYKYQKRMEISEETGKISEDMKAQGLAAIDKAIEAQNAVDLDRAQARAKDTDYSHRLNEKVSIIRGIVTKNEIRPAELDALRVMLEEFTDDTLAISAITAAVEGTPGARRILQAIPEDHTGEFQKNMETLKTMFSMAIDYTRKGPAEHFNGFTAQSADAFYYYCFYQEPTLKSDPGETWNRVCTDHPELFTAAGMWAMRFGVADKITK